MGLELEQDKGVFKGEKYWWISAKQYSYDDDTTKVLLGLRATRQTPIDKTRFHTDVYKYSGNLNRDQMYTKIKLEDKFKTAKDVLEEGQ